MKIIKAIRQTAQQIGYTTLVAILSVLLTISSVAMTGCSKPTQASINTAVADIGNVAGIINSSASSLQAAIAVFPVADQAVLTNLANELVNGSALIKTLSATYLASPSPTVLGQISTAFSALAANGAQALLSVAQIKDSNSQAAAQAILAAIATGLAVLSGYLATTGVSVSASTKSNIEQMKPFLNREFMTQQLQVAKSQGLVPQNATLASVGF